MPTKEQTRAKQIYALIVQAEQLPNKAAYGRLCLRLPFLIRANGLCQTLAFLESKTKNEKPEFGQLIIDLAKVASGKTGIEYCGSARSAPTDVYMLMTREALACAQWFKRYAEAVLKIDPTEDAT